MKEKSLGDGFEILTMRLSSTVIIFVITISLFASSTIPFVEIIKEADALKSKGTYVKQYGSATKSIVCGDRLCSEIPKSISSELSEKALKGMQTEKSTPDALTMIKKEQMETSVNSQNIISDKSIHKDFPTIQILTTIHASQIDPVTYLVELEITAGNKDLEVVVISVYSDIETINTEIPGLSSNSKGIQHVIINANDPSSITAHIQSYN
jgi:hypothetical protein